MASTTNRLLAARISFRKRDWELSDYPVVVCENEANPRPAKQRYIALIPNWNVGGAGQSEAEALQALEKNFAKAEANRISSGGSIPDPEPKFRLI